MRKSLTTKRLILGNCIVILLSSLGACSLIQPVATPQITYYQLQETSQRIAKPASALRNRTILVMAPTANDNYQSKNMLYSTDQYQIKSYAKNRWAAPPSQMVLTGMVAGLRNSQQFHAVVAPPFSGVADFQLTTQLLHFEQIFVGEHSYFNLVILAVLINNNTHRVIAERRFAEHVIAPENNPYGGVVAANQATTNFIQQLSRWCRRSLL